MILEITWLPKTIPNDDWATYLWILCLICLVIAKFLSETRFHEFLRIFSTDKYLKLHKENSLFINWFVVIFFIVKLISFSFLTIIIADYLGFADKKDAVTFIRISTFLGTFFLAKILIEKIIATSFNIEEDAAHFSFYKVNYQSYIGLLILPLIAILYYQENMSSFLLTLVLCFTLFLMGFTYFKTIQIHQKWLFSKLFYFILYLCALEIIPYYFIFYWLKKI